VPDDRFKVRILLTELCVSNNDFSVAIVHAISLHTSFYMLIINDLWKVSEIEESSKIRGCKELYENDTTL